MLYSTVFFLAMVASALSSAVLTKRAGFNCNSAYNTCVAQPDADTADCTQKFEACQSCAQAEDTCRVGAGSGMGLNCTVEAQVCYFNAENPSTTEGIYDCVQALLTCNSAYNTNHAFCASHNAGCKFCQRQEDRCRSADDANQSSCSSQANQCFMNAMN